MCRTNKGKNGVGKTRPAGGGPGGPGGPGSEEEESEGLALLMADIQHSAGIVQASTRRLKAQRTADSVAGDAEAHLPSSPIHHAHNSSIDKLYIAVMKDLQFGE